MFKVLVYVGLDPKANVLVDSNIGDNLLFKTKEAAYSHALKVRDDSSLNVWFKVVPVDEEVNK